MLLKVCHGQSVIFSTLPLFFLYSLFYCPVFVIPNAALSAALSACLYVHKIVRLCVCVCVCASVETECHRKGSDRERVSVRRVGWSLQRQLIANSR